MSNTPGWGVEERKEENMKNMKKLSALVVAMLLVLAMAVPAMADPEPTPAPTYDYPLTVTGLAKGDTVKFYQVIEWVGDATGNVSGWKAKAPFDSVLDHDKLVEVLVGTPAVAADPEHGIEAQEAKAATGITSELAGLLAKAASGSGVEPDEQNDTTATLDNAESGMWMALVTPADANTLYNPVFVSADYNKQAGGTVGMGDGFADAVVKSSTLKLTKTASTEEDTNDDQKSTTTAVGDTVKFNVETAIPGYGDVYTNPHFVLTDSLTDLELNEDSVTLKAPTGLKKKGDDGVADEEADYIVETTKGGYTITFTEKYLKTVKSATDVEVEYTAVVTSTAAYAVNEEKNEVKIEYSHDPHDQSDYDVKKDTTQHYTFTLDASGIGKGEKATQHGTKTSELIKTGVDAAGNPITSQTPWTSTIEDEEKETFTNPLDGAEFGLFTDSTGTTLLKNKAGEDMKTTTGTDGRMTFTGLDAGTYYLKEIKAPTGFVTNTHVYTVVITAETEEVTVTETIGTKEVTYKTDILKSYSVTIDGTEAAKYVFTNDTEPTSTDIQWDNAVVKEVPYEFENTKGTELPSTGGMGTTVLYVAGSILVLGAVVLMITRRRVRG